MGMHGLRFSDKSLRGEETEEEEAVVTQTDGEKVYV